MLELLFKRVEVYAKTNFEIFKLASIDKAADVISTLASKVVLLTIGILVACLLSIGIALWIGDSIGKSYYGFFIVAAFYTLVGILLFIFHERLIKRPINDSIIIQMQKENEYAKRNTK